jgi:hypothetical protein
LSDGFQPWLDEEDLLPGQEWAREIARAVRTCDVIIVCLSRTSVTKEGFVQKEIRQALDIADEKPEGTIFVIPVSLASLGSGAPRKMLSILRWTARRQSIRVIDS